MFGLFKSSSVRDDRLGYRAHGRGDPVRTVGIVLAISVAVACGSDQKAIRQLDESIARELPAGTPATKVVAFLDDHRLEHSDYTKPPGPASLRAIVRDRSWWHLVKSSYSLDFLFDENQRLRTYRVEVVRTGP